VPRPRAAAETVGLNDTAGALRSAHSSA
jgi:hypothetical protein